MQDYNVLFTEERYKNTVEFWRQQLANINGGFRWEVKQDVALEPNYIRYPFTLTSAAEIVLQRLANDEIGRFTILLAATAYTLSRYFQQTIVIFITPTLSSSNGNGLPIIISVQENLTIGQYLQSVAAILTETYAYDDFPINSLLQEDYEPKFNELTNIFISNLVLHQPLPYHSADICISLNGNGKCEISYQAEKIEGFLISQFTDHITFVLEQFATLHNKLLNVALLSQAQTETLMAISVGKEVARAIESVVSLFEQQVCVTPNHKALIYGDQVITYKTLNAEANKLARYLQEHLTIQSESRVGIMLDRSPYSVIAILAALKSGIAYVPIDPEYPLERIQYMLTDADVMMLITQYDYMLELQSFTGQLFIMDLQLANLDLPEGNLAKKPYGEDLAYIIYTSGSTGMPKGCALEHRNLTNYLTWAMEYYFAEEGNFALYSSLAFDFTITNIFCSLLRGKTLVIYDQSQSIDQILQQAFEAKSGLDTMKLTPSHISLLEELNIEATSIKKVIVGGEEVRTSHITTLTKIDSTMDIYNEYGPTEATVGCIVKKIAMDDQKILIGRPIDNTQIYILDREQRLVPIGVKGEIYIGGNSLARGYHKRAALTAEKFCPHPFANGKRIYKTGDIGCWLQNGDIAYIGRSDDQVKIHGFRIELAEIESILAEHKEVTQALVIAREDRPGEKRLVAYVVGASSLTSTALREFLASKLPSYMLPALFIFLPNLPLNTNGKVNKKALPVPEDIVDEAVNIVAATTVYEAELLSIWQEVLHRERISIHDNFFALGGDSLTAVQVILRVWQTLGIELQLNDLFDTLTVAGLATRIHNLEKKLINHKPTITPTARNIPIPLSFAQQRLWFLAQFEGGSAAYHIAGGVRLTGKLDRNALLMALDRIVVRHEALRTTFVQVDGEPQQCIANVEDSRFHLTECDLSAETEAEQVLQQLAEQEALKPFDLVQGPLIRGRLVKMKQDQHVLLITMHHIISDGWSISIFIRELGTLYSAYQQGQSDPLPPLSIQYPDYAAWQRQWVTGERLSQQADYWKRTLTGTPTLLELPADRPRPAQQDYAGAAIEVTLNAELTAKLRHLSKRQGSTMFMTLLASWALLMSRLSGQNEVVVGTPTANRSLQEIELLIGLFVNTLAMRIDLTDNPTVAQLLARVKEQSLAAQVHQDIPFEQIVEILQPPRSFSHAPLFQVMFAWQNTPQSKFDLPGITLSLVEAPHASAKFDLSLSLQETEDKIVGNLEYASALFDHSTVERYLSYWRTLLIGIVENENQNVERLPILSDQQRQMILYDWNATEADYPKDKCIHELFEEQVSKTPEAIAVVYEEQSLTYAELNTQANQLAHYLHELGVVPDRLVGICVERGLNMVIGLLAILKAGGAYVPLDPAYPKQRLGFMLQDSAPVVLLVEPATRRILADVADYIPRVNLVDDQPQWAKHSQINLYRQAIGLTSEHLAYVIYTSGSTGQPKGAMNEHQGVVNRLHWMQHRYELDLHDAVLQKTPFSFDVSVWEFFWPLLTGARLVMAKPGGHKEPAYLNEVILRESITTMHFVPPMLQVFLEYQQANYPNLLRVICSGEALPGALVKHFHQQLPATELHNLYGPTEAAVDVTEWTCINGFPKDNTPIGRPIANTRIYLLDPHGEPVSIGVAGELHIGGVQVARGYLNRPDLTAEKFIKDPFSSMPNARMYRTGDLARWLPDGNIEFLGRNDFQVKIRGFRIELGEIEARLATHPTIRQVTVLVREDATGDKRLVAYYTSEAEVAIENLRAHLTATLPDYMVPAAYVRLEAMPLTPNGKLDRKALSALEGNAYGKRVYAVPISEIEQTVARIWADLLKLDRVGRHDNFFELGGHSLLAVTLIERLRRAGLHTDVRTLFTSSTLADLAATMGSVSRKTEVPPNLILPGCDKITPEMLPLITLNQMDIDHIIATVPGGVANVQDIYALGPLQKGILFHHLLANQGDTYILFSLLAFESRQRLDGFLTSLQDVISRHDILRTAILWERLSEPAQVVWREATLPVVEVEFDISKGDISYQLTERFHPQNYRIDLTIAPLIRAFITYDPAQDRWLLVLLFHHLASDHTTLEIIIEEIHAFQLGQADHLPKPLPFRNFIAETKLGITGEEHERFFRTILGDVNETTAPFGMIDVQGDGSGIEEAKLRLDDTLARRVRERARSLGVSAASLFHLAWAQVLAKTSGNEAVVFGTVLFGRMQGGAGSDRLLGMFINTLPVRIDINEVSVLERVRQVHNLLAELLRHEHAPLALAQRCSAVPAGVPLFTALLNYRHSLEGNETSERMGWEGIEVLSAEERTNYPFTLSIDDLGIGFLLTAQTQSPIAPERICAFMQTAIEKLIDALETTPEAAICSLDILPMAERQTVLYDWNATEADYPKDKCIHELFESQVDKTPEATAVVYEDQQLTYAELNVQANQLAHYLCELGVGPDCLVGICVERGLNMIIGLLAILKARGAYVPLDPAYPKERLSYMLQDSAPVALLVEVATQEILVEVANNIPRVNLIDDQTQWAKHSQANLESQATGLMPEHLAYIIYTSGTTGRPKGVAITHHSLINLLSGLNQTIYRDRLDDQLRVSVNGSLAFDTSVKQIIQIANGHTLVIIPAEVRDNPRAFVEYVHNHSLDVLDTTPSYLELLLDNAIFAQSTTISKVLVGGEAISRELWQRLSKIENVEFYNLYGPTETTVDATIAQVNTDNAWPVIGKPINNVWTYVLDEKLRSLPIDVIGELYIGGEGLARGYLNDAGLSATVFLPDPYQMGARIYKTGDKVRRDCNGNLEFIGRVDQQIKQQGFRIEPHEIEMVLESYPTIARALVSQIENGATSKSLVAYLLKKPDCLVDRNKLQDFLRQKLPDYMLPTFYIEIEQLPLTAHGKVDYRALPIADRSLYALSYIPPRNEIERRLVDIWQQVLGINGIGIKDNFFNLGGHSLLAMKTVGYIQREWSIKLPLAQFLQNPTIEELASKLGNNGKGLEWQTLVRMQSGGNGRPIFLLPGAGGNIFYYYPLAKYLAINRPVYGLQAIGLNGMELPLTSIVEIARHNIEKILEIQPEGQYLLAGHSFGGKVAFEMSQQLRAAGHRVGMVAILDTPAPIFEKKSDRTDWNDTQWLIQIVSEIAEFLRMDTSLTYEQLEFLTAEEQINLVIEKIKQTGWWGEDWDSKQLRGYLEVYKTNYKMDYQIQENFYPVPLLLLKTAEQSEVVSGSTLSNIQQDWDWGWNKFSSTMVEVNKINGDHLSMLTMDNALMIAEKIETFIARH